MRVLPVDPASPPGARAAVSWLSSLPADPSASLSPVALLLDRVLGVAVLALMGIAGVVIAAVTWGVLMGLIV